MEIFLRYDNILTPMKLMKATATKQEGGGGGKRIIGDPDPNVEISALTIQITPNKVDYSSKTEDNVVWPSLNDDESYRLSIDGPTGSILFGTSVWGILKGLETFSQMFDMVDGMLMHSKLIVEDAPRWKYRGIMLDTGRHFLSASQFKATIDGMAYNKFNVLHWHITDVSI